MNSTLPEGEAPIDPGQPIIDPHHHLWDRAPLPGYFDCDARHFLDLVRNSGHAIVATVYLDCGSGYLADGPEHMRGSGETAYAARAAATAEGSGIGLCAGIVTNADLTLEPARLDELLDAHQRLGGGRLRGVRRMSAWDEDPDLRLDRLCLPRGALREPRIHDALRRVAARGLSFDAWMHFHQLDDLACLADAVPELPIVLDHLGGSVLIGPYAGREAEVFARWRQGIDTVAARPNVTLKLGGAFLGPASRFDPAQGSAGFAELLRPWLDHAIGRFGPDRCMFESNFPVDGGHIAYGTLWNAFKRHAAPMSGAERDALFFGTANRVYRLGLAIDDFRAPRADPYCSS